ncbi:hypothetical protein DRA43_16065 [Micromonospora provocatoris]|nr:hypothetical protein DRA43_16065 [Micromonospora provocatoris]
MLRLLERARERQVGVPSLTTTDYINTIPPERLVDAPRAGRRDRTAVGRGGGGLLRHRGVLPFVGVAAAAHQATPARATSATRSRPATRW